MNHLNNILLEGVLTRDPEVVAVFGQEREEGPGYSFYSCRDLWKLCRESSGETQQGHDKQGRWSPEDGKVAQ